MKVISFILLFFLIGNSSANQCVNSPGENMHVKNVYHFTDTSPQFTKHDLRSYKAGSFDIDTEDFSVNKFGNLLTITGNTWKRLRLTDSYTATPNTVLEFEFRAVNDEAEINGVGLMMHGSSGFHSNRFFQVHGTQTAHNQSYHNYTGNKWIRYQIPIWNSLSNTPEKRIASLVFAGDDDGTQVNQKAMYKNVRLIEQIPTYQLPLGFQHNPVVIKPSRHKDIFHHIHPQTITGPNGITYAVSGGYVTKKYYSPPNTNISELLSVHESYYENMCWDGGISYSISQLQSLAHTNLQSLVGIEGRTDFNSSLPVVLDTKSEFFFDPDFVLSDGLTKAPAFYGQTVIFSSHSHEFYFEKFNASNASSVNKGFGHVAAASSEQTQIQTQTCNTPPSGANTLGVCFDLTGKTDEINSNKFLAFNTLSEVYDADSSHNSIRHIDGGLR